MDGSVPPFSFCSDIQKKYSSPEEVHSGVITSGGSEQVTPGSA